MGVDVGKRCLQNPPLTKTQILQGPYDLQDSKVILSESGARGSHKPLQGRSLAVVVDHSCVRSQAGALTSSVLDRFQNGQHAHVVNIEEGWSIDSLDRVANTDPCVVYVGENHTYYRELPRSSSLPINGST